MELTTRWASASPAIMLRNNELYMVLCGIKPQACLALGFEVKMLTPTEGFA